MTQNKSIVKVTDDLQYSIPRQELFIRPYQSEDCRKLIDLFYTTVHCVNARDYTQAQLKAWATGEEDDEKWNASFLSHHTFIALFGNVIVGFGNIDNTGYLDMLYVHKDYQRKGIASALCDRLELLAESVIQTQASITAKSFFEHRGFKTINEQTVERKGIYLTNFIMAKKK